MHCLLPHAKNKGCENRFLITDHKEEEKMVDRVNVELIPEQGLSVIVTLLLLLLLLLILLLIPNTKHVLANRMLSVRLPLQCLQCTNNSLFFYCVV